MTQFTHKIKFRYDIEKMGLFIHEINMKLDSHDKKILDC